MKVVLLQALSPTEERQLDDECDAYDFRTQPPGAILRADLLPEELTAAKWPLMRRPYLMETSIPGVFCVGDARSSSVKRVASAVGEGSICVQLVHRVLAE